MKVYPEKGQTGRENPVEHRNNVLFVLVWPQWHHKVSFPVMFDCRPADSPVLQWCPGDSGVGEPLRRYGRLRGKHWRPTAGIPQHHRCLRLIWQGAYNSILLCLGYVSMWNPTPRCFELRYVDIIISKTGWNLSLSFQNPDFAPWKQDQAAFLHLSAVPYSCDQPAQGRWQQNDMIQLNLAFLLFLRVGMS